jgi:hypothetical protein
MAKGNRKGHLIMPFYVRAEHPLPPRPLAREHKTIIIRPASIDPPPLRIGSGRGSRTRTLPSPNAPLIWGLAPAMQRGFSSLPINPATKENSLG